MNNVKVTLVDSIAVEYCKLKFSNKNMVILYNLSEATLSNAENLCRRLGIEYIDCLVNDYVFVEFSDVNDALDFCNSVPDSDPYCLVIQNNKVVHENT